HPRQILRPDHHQGDERDDQQLAGIDTEHDAPFGPRVRRIQAWRSPSGVATGGGEAAGSAGGGAGIGLTSSGRSSAIRRDAGSSSSSMPFLKLFMPLATSPMRPETR